MNHNGTTRTWTAGGPTPASGTRSADGKGWRARRATAVHENGGPLPGDGTGPRIRLRRLRRVSGPFSAMPGLRREEVRL